MTALESNAVLERSSKLEAAGWVHGFTTRAGGVSTGRYATLNMSEKWGDDPQAVVTNRRRVADEAGFEIDTLVIVRQVHGADVVRAVERTSTSAADAVWAERGDGPIVVGVLTADCVPILIGDEDGRLACAVHSGWRGTVANVVGAAVAKLVEHGAVPSRLIAAIGPCIEVDAFEVGPEVAQAFEPRFVRTDKPKPHVDLVAVVGEQLRRAGVAMVERVGGCTHAHPDRYFSYRRDGANIGQQLSFIGWGTAEGDST